MRPLPARQVIVVFKKAVILVSEFDVVTWAASSVPCLGNQRPSGDTSFSLLCVCS